MLVALAFAAIHTGCTDVGAGSGDAIVSVVASQRIRAMTYSSRRPPDPGTLEDLHELGVSHIALIPFGYQRSFSSPSVRFNPNQRWFTESDSGITDVAFQARALGMGTILKPHIWVGRHSTDGQQRDQIGFETEDEWLQWESEYRRFILHYAGLAEAIQADIFVVGTELATAARLRPDFWRGVIKEIRTRYQGKLTYAANWYREFEDIQFWSELDFVGVQAYFPLSDQAGPSASALRKGWASHRDKLAAVSQSAGKPVLFTEIGYRSIADAAVEPWKWASRQQAQVTESDNETQANLYTAFFEEVWPQPWFAGACIWRWHTASETRGAVSAIDFTPQGKPSLDVIRSGFHAGR